MEKRLVGPVVVALVCGPEASCCKDAGPNRSAPSDIPIISGTITNPQGKGVKECDQHAVDHHGNHID